MENFPLGGYIWRVSDPLLGTCCSPRGFCACCSGLLQPAQWLLGVPGRLAGGQLRRALRAGRRCPCRRSTIGVAMAMCIAGFVGSFQTRPRAWIDQSVPADFFVTSSSQAGGRAERADEAGARRDDSRRLPGVKHVDRVRIFPHDLMGLRIYVISLMPEIYDTAGQAQRPRGSPADARRAARRAASPSPRTSRAPQPARRERASRWPRPPGCAPTRSAAVVVDYTSDQGTLFLDRADLHRAVPGRPGGHLRALPLGH